MKIEVTEVVQKVVPTFKVEYSLREYLYVLASLGETKNRERGQSD